MNESWHSDQALETKETSIHARNIEELLLGWWVYIETTASLTYELPLHFWRKWERHWQNYWQLHDSEGVCWRQCVTGARQGAHLGYSGGSLAVKMTLDGKLIVLLLTSYSALRTCQKGKQNRVLVLSGAQRETVPHPNWGLLPGNCWPPQQQIQHSYLGERWSFLRRFLQHRQPSFWLPELRMYTVKTIINLKP